MGSYINIDQWGYIGGDFESYATSNPLYMHEYGHTIDSRAKGPAYLFVVGIPSLISASNNKPVEGKKASSHDYRSFEMRANRNAKKYFGKHYGVNWNAINHYSLSYKDATIEEEYPTHI